MMVQEDLVEPNIITNKFD